MDSISFLESESFIVSMQCTIKLFPAAFLMNIKNSCVCVSFMYKSKYVYLWLEAVFVRKIYLTSR